MEDKIKSAFERAMEKVDKLGKATPEELAKLEHTPKGSTLAARFLREKELNLKDELAKHDESVRRYVADGVNETLFRNIILPQNSQSKETTKRAIEGILALKKSRAKAQAVVGKMEHLFNYYEQTRQQTYMKLREAFESKIAEQMRAAGQQLSNKAKIDVERHPQFQAEWRRALADLSAQYERVLAEQKQELQSSP